MNADKNFHASIPAVVFLIRFCLRASAVKFLFLTCILSMAVSAQVPPIEPGVSHELAKWRASRYSDVRYKLNLTLEKMSPVLKGTMEIRVKVAQAPSSLAGVPIILDWRHIRGSESLSSISNVYLNGVRHGPVDPRGFTFDGLNLSYQLKDEHLIFTDAVAPGENVIKLDFTSPILTSGSAITRYIDKEDGSEYIYSLFVPSDASTAFPVFDQPDLKARFSLEIECPESWQAVSNTKSWVSSTADQVMLPGVPPVDLPQGLRFEETKPISTYVFAFAAGPFQMFADKGGNPSGGEGAQRGNETTQGTLPTGRVSPPVGTASSGIYVRKSQAAKFQPHAAEVFRLNRDGIKFLEQYTSTTNSRSPNTTSS